MYSVNPFAIPTRILIGLWVEIILCGSIARAQERRLDTLHLFCAHADTVRMGLYDILPLSATGDSNFHYLYRWFSYRKKIGEESVLNYSFTGERKAKVIGQRFSTALPWPGEEYLDMEYFKENSSITYDFIDTIYLKAFSEYESDSTATWIWTIKAEAYDERKYTLFGPRIKFTYDNNETNFFEGYTVTCTLLTKTEEKHTPEGHIKFWSDYRVRKMRLTDSGRRGAYYMNVVDIESARIYAHKEDTLYFDGRASQNPIYYLEWSQADVTWTYHGKVYYRTPSFHISFDGAQYKDFLDYYGFVSLGNGNGKGKEWFMYVYWDIDPDAEIETDSVWVFFPYYPYSNLGDRVDVCLLPDAPLPSAEDTVYTFNLGPWNRELEYVEYAWFDGTKTATGKDSVVGTDSAFAYLFGRMDSVSPELYTGMLVTRVASDSLWQDSCNCYVPCTDAACSGYDTVRIYLHLRKNAFLPYDTTLCAHLDLELDLSDTAGDYHCFWLDRDSIEMPYGHDTARFTVQGMRGLDGYGAGTDTREPRFFQLRLDHKLCGVSFFDTLLVYDQVKPNFELLCHDTLICLDEPVKIDTLSPQVYRPFYVFEWSDGTKGSGYTFTDSGTYILKFFVDKDFAVCGYDTAFDTIYVRWSDPAQTHITLSDTSFCEKISSTVVLDAKVPCSSTRYSWQEGPLPEEDFWEDPIIFTDPVIKVDREMTLSLLLVDTMGCVNAKQIEVTENDCSPKLEIPNVFTPNGDGVNDVWKFRQLEWCVDVKVEVVDRWGQPVLKTKVATANDFEWNGRVNNTGARLPDGPYFYMVTYKDVYGKSKVQSGSITILGTSE